MPKTDMRNYPRSKISNDVSYACLDDQFQEIEHGLGKVLNISQSGALLETPKVIHSKYIMIMSIDLQDKMIDIKGNVIYSTKDDSKRVLTGVNFMEPYSIQRKAITEFIKAYHYRAKTAK